MCEEMPKAKIKAFTRYELLSPLEADVKSSIGDVDAV